MEKGKCCLCQEKTRGLFGKGGKMISNSYINDIPQYYSLFPDAPYKQFGIGDSEVCGFCMFKIFNLFGCDINATVVPFQFLPDTCSDSKMDEAVQYVEKRFQHLPQGNEKRFFEYALSMPSKINQLRNELPAKKLKVKQDVVATISNQESIIQNILSYIKSQNRFLESNSYTFGIVNNNFVYAAFSEASSKKYIEDLRSKSRIVFYCMDKHLDFETMCQYFIESVNNVAPPNFIEIPINKIKHFKIKGSIGYSSNVCGGGGSGGGVNLGGAIAGGLLFGGVGAMIGSQINTEIKINPIHTIVTKHDDRNVEFFYEDKSGNTVSTIFDPSAYDCFMKLIPEKAYDSVMAENLSSVANNVKQAEQPTVTSTTTMAKPSLSQLKELKELLDMGIITQEEFDTKKKQLLGL